MSLRDCHPFSGKGCIGRIEFVLTTVSALCLFFLVYYAVEWVLLRLGTGEIINTIALLIMIIPAADVVFAAHFKRLRDMKKSPWFTLLMFAPYLNVILWLWLAFARQGADKAVSPITEKLKKSNKRLDF